MIDCTPANDLPVWDGSENSHYNTRLGFGPSIYVADNLTLSDPRLIRHLLATADKEGIPYQLRQPGGGGTDAGAIHRQRSGIPSVSSLSSGTLFTYMRPGYAGFQTGRIPIPFFILPSIQ